MVRVFRLDRLNWIRVFLYHNSIDGRSIIFLTSSIIGDRTMTKIIVTKTYVNTLLTLTKLNVTKLKLLS